VQELLATIAFSKNGRFGAICASVAKVGCEPILSTFCTAANVSNSENDQKYETGAITAVLNYQSLWSIFGKNSE
jgi:hypothetical protein|tara:strand:+ start:113 stop:334 length:222 start_codon:yes stop_codon:yes gene_type:complete